MHHILYGAALVYKMRFPEYQSNYIENCLVLFTICPVRFSNLPGFNRPFLSVEMGDCLLAAPVERQERFPLFPFLAIMTLGFVHVFCPLERMNKLFLQEGRKLFQSPKRIACATAYGSHRCEESLLLVILARFFRCSRKAFRSKSLAQN